MSETKKDAQMDPVQDVSEQAAKLGAAQTDRPSTASKVEAAINEWFTEHVHNSPVAQHTAGLNHLRQSLSHLKDKIVEAVG